MRADETVLVLTLSVLFQRWGLHRFTVGLLSALMFCLCSSRMLKAWFELSVPGWEFSVACFFIDLLLPPFAVISVCALCQGPS